MEDIHITRWNDFAEALRRHYPNLTDQEIRMTGGKFENVEQLIYSKSDEDRTEIRRLLAYIFDETQSGNPNTIDDMAGIEEAQDAPPTPESNEWKAREDENRP